MSQLRSRDARAPPSSRRSSTTCATRSIYLKVKLRKERTLARSEYADVRDRIEDRAHARARRRRDGRYHASRLRRRSTPAPAAPRRAARGHDAARATRRAARVEIPAGTEIDVRLQNTLNSGTAQVEDRFEATTLVDLEHRRPHRDSRRLGDARRRHGRRAGDAHQPHREDDGQLRSGHGQRPRVSDARHRDAGDRGRRHQGRGRRASAPAPASARSSAASSAASRARSPAS